MHVKLVGTSALIVAMALSVASCGGSATDAGQPFVESPLPTIGLGSDTGSGSISGGADVRAIDVGAIESVVMIGDSITVGSTPLLDEQLRQLGFAEVTISAQTGKRMDVSFGSNASGSSIARFVAGDQNGSAAETLWIVALGTNDIGQYSSDDEIESAIDEVLAPIPDNAPLVWINTYFRDRVEGTIAVNEAIERRLVERGNATIGRWSEVAPNDGILRSDGVHPGDDGAKVFAQFVTLTVADFLQR